MVPGRTFPNNIYMKTWINAYMEGEISGPDVILLLKLGALHNVLISNTATPTGLVWLQSQRLKALSSVKLRSHLVDWEKIKEYFLQPSNIRTLEFSDCTIDNLSAWPQWVPLGPIPMTTLRCINTRACGQVRRWRDFLDDFKDIVVFEYIWSRPELNPT